MNRVYNFVTQRIVRELEKGTVPWKKPWFTKKVNYISRRPYHGINLVLLDSPGEYLTWNQVQKQGGRVKKGSSSYMVTFYKMVEKTEENEDGEPETVAYPVLRYYRIFHLDDVKGIKSKFELTPISTNGQAAKIANEYRLLSGLQVKHVKSDKAYWSPSKDIVLMPVKNQFDSMEGYYSTLFHELIHSTAHESRLDRNHSTNKLSSDYSQEELVAEIGATMLLSHAGLDIEKTVKNTASYVKGWLQRLKGDRTLIVRAASRAQKAVDYILAKK